MTAAIHTEEESFQNLDHQLSSLVGDSKKVMVYGFSHCGWEELGLALEKMGRYEVLQFDVSLDRFTFNYDDQSSLSSFTGPLTKLVLENYLKTLQKEPLIPCLFTIDCNNNPYSKVDAFQLKQNKDELITFEELMRVYRLAFDPKIDPRIQAVARQSFIFLRVEQERYRDYESEKRYYKLKNRNYVSDQIPENKRLYVKRVLSIAQIAPPWPNSWVFQKKRGSLGWKDQVNAVCALLDSETYKTKKPF